MTLKVPNLSGLKLNSPALMPMLIVGEKPRDHIFVALVVNLVRIVDIGLTDYLNMRKCLLKYWYRKNSSSVPLGFLLLAAGHFEACISNLKRAIVHLKKIRGFSTVPRTTNDLLRKKYGVLSGKVEGRVTKMRDSIQHLEKRIREGKIRKGEAIYPSSSDKDGMKLGSHKIKFDELAQWIQELHTLCAALVVDWRIHYCGK